MLDTPASAYNICSLKAHDRKCSKFWQTATTFSIQIYLLDAARWRKKCFSFRPFRSEVLAVAVTVRRDSSVWFWGSATIAEFVREIRLSSIPERVSNKARAKEGWKNRAFAIMDFRKYVTGMFTLMCVYAASNTWFLLVGLAVSTCFYYREYAFHFVSRTSILG